MATEKPRITITLEPEQHAVLKRLAELQGGSMSRIVSEFLGEATPILAQVADSLETAQRASADARAKFVRAAEEAEKELRPLAEFARNQFDLFSAQLNRLVEDQGTPADSSRTPAHGAEASGARSEPWTEVPKVSHAKRPRPVITGATVSGEAQRGSRGEVLGVALSGASKRAK